MFPHPSAASRLRQSAPLLMASLLAIGLFLLLTPQGAAAPAQRAAAETLLDTVVEMDIFTDTVWNAAGSPYILPNNLNLTVGPTATLTIEPGVEVRVAPNREIRIKGRLIAQGSEIEEHHRGINDPDHERDTRHLMGRVERRQAMPNNNNPTIKNIVP